MTTLPPVSRPDWHEYYMGIAMAVRRRANCIGNRVGAILVVDNHIVATGYNGTPSGLPNCDEGGCEQGCGEENAGPDLPAERSRQVGGTQVLRPQRHRAAVLRDIHPDLTEEVIDCPDCGISIDRDLNASLNIRNIGINTVGHTGINACGDGSLELSLKQEKECLEN